MGSIIVVVIFPLLESFGEQARIVDDLSFEEAVELFGVDAVGSLYLPVQTGGAGADLDVADALVEQVPVECLPELLTVVGLYLLNLEWQFREHVIDELDRGLLVVARVGAQDPDAGAVVDRGVLILALLLPCLPEWLDELHVDLQGAARSLLLVALPTRLGALVALRRGEPVQADFLQNPPDSGGADRDVVIAGQIHRDLVWPEVILLPQPEDLLDHFRVGFVRLMVWLAGAILEPFEALFFVAAFPFVVGLPADAVVAAGCSDVPADLIDVPQHGEFVLRSAFELSL